METQVIVANFPPGASRLFLDLLGLKPIDLFNGINHCRDYKTIRLKKRSGGYRTINEPHEDLKKIQTRLLKHWLYRIYYQKYLDNRIYSFLPERSTIQSIQAHADNINSNYVTRFDLKDAFPSISADLIGRALRWAIEKEFPFMRNWQERKEENRYGKGKYGWKRNYSRNPLFPNSKVRWFRSLFRKEGTQYLVDDMIDRFIKMVLGFTTYQGCLPQGAPTSPFLLNLVVSYLQLPGLITAWLKANGYPNFVTVYCDDFIISTFREPSPKILAGIINVIETTGLKVNIKKTQVFNRHQISPSVLGLKLIKKNISGDEVEKLNKQPTIKGALRRYRKGGVWRLNKVAVSKEYIRQTRAMMHNLSLNPLDEKLCNTVKGRLNYLKSVYGVWNMPTQLQKPYLEMKKAGIIFKHLYS